MKTIIVDGKAYDVMVNIRIDVDNNNYSKKEEYVYSIRFRDNKTVATSLFHPASSKATRQFDATTNDIISQNSEKSTLSAKKMFSLGENDSTRNDNFDADEFLRKAMENGGMIEKAVDTEVKAGEAGENNNLEGKRSALDEPTLFTRI